MKSTVVARTLLVSVVSALAACGGPGTPGSSRPDVSSMATRNISDTTEASGAVGTSTRVSPLTAVRTGRQGNEIVAAYVGGTCESNPVLIATETPTTVEIYLEVEVQVGWCSAVGKKRTAAVTLGAPIDGREIISGNVQLHPFDGDRLLTPKYLPDTYQLAGEDGIGESVMTSGATTVWEQKFTSVGSRANESNCSPSGSTLSTVQASGASLPSTFLEGPATEILVGELPGKVIEQVNGPGPGRRSVVWTTSNHDQIAVTSIAPCQAAEPLAVSALLEVAESMST